MSYRDKLKPVGSTSQHPVDTGYSATATTTPTSGYKSKLKPATSPAGQPERGFGTELAAGLLKTPARVLTSGINAAQIITGNEQTTPFSGDFLGRVEPLGYSSKTGEKLPLWQAGKDIAGGAAEIGSYFVGGPAAKSALTTLKSGKLLARPTLSAFYQGGKAAAPAFALGSAGQSLQDEEKGIGQNLVDTATGYAAGFGTGGLFGVGGRALEKTGIPGRLFSGVERSKNTAEAIEQAAKIPKISPEKAAKEALEISREPIAAVEKQAIEEGGSRIGKEGIFRSAPIAQSTREIPVTEAVQGLVQEGKLRASMPKNQQQQVIRQRVSQINEGVKDLAKRYNEPFNGGELMNRLNKAKEGNRILFGNDKAAIDAYDAVIDEYLKYVKKNNVSGLLDSRQDFDRYIRESFPKAFQEDILTGAVNPRYQALRDVRGVANNFAADLLSRYGGSSTAGDAFLNGLRNEHYLLSAADNIALKMKGLATSGGKIPRIIDSKTFKRVRNIAGAGLTFSAGLGGLKYLYDSKN